VGELKVKIEKWLLTALAALQKNGDCSWLLQNFEGSLKIFELI
jgi:hypothetical protein